MIGLFKKWTSAIVISNLFAYSTMVPFTRENGSLSKMAKVKKMDAVYKYGQMALVMTVSGATVWLMAMVALYTRKAMCMKVSGQRIRQMAMVFTLILMAVDTKVNGLQTNNTDLALSSGRTVPSTTDNMNRV